MAQKKSFSNFGIIPGSIVSPLRVESTDERTGHHRFAAAAVRNGWPAWRPYRPGHVADREREQAVAAFVAEVQRRALGGLAAELAE